MSKRVEIAGVPFDPVTEEGALAAVEGFMAGSKTRHIVTPNPEMVLAAQRDSEFADILRNADLSLPDGVGILWAAHYLSSSGENLLASLARVALRPKKLASPLPARVTGTDMMFRIVEASQTRKWRIFLLGAAPGVAQRAVDKLLVSYPDAIFAGADSSDPSPELEPRVLDAIERAKTDILLVAYGHPIQEKWIARNLKRLGDVKVVVGVGGAFDFAAGEIKRAPQFMRRSGLEWLWRLACQPSRFGRIWNATVRFPSLVKRYSMDSSSLSK